MEIRLNTPLTPEAVKTLKPGDTVYLTGVLYAARDAAHKKLMELLDAGQPLPFDLKGAVIYYVGPSPTKEGEVIGSAGPTTSSRMDAYTPRLLELGLKGMVGKGRRSEAVKKSMVEQGAVYFAAIGGAGALIKETILAQEVVAYPELGPEAVRKLEVKDFPVTVIIDSEGQDLYELGREAYLAWKAENED
ncbi:Fe-S-containing hydro-lyase [Proteiniclasticum sp. BAD-10]|uniref:Fe-S-containing hydro-lyase n=1 Tax=Proteiniclasticum sediminis TaxID=2804028 RepID=A0A941CP26_9CLOT|nr:Fe-S-containing hydro-lyase [Proteiniclasticum sediminis]MBR0576260.1 Fe-S-containing hydro-lyase [Proteiniclasticum sediminis]